MEVLWVEARRLDRRPDVSGENAVEQQSVERIPHRQKAAAAEEESIERCWKEAAAALHEALEFGVAERMPSLLVMGDGREERDEGGRGARTTEEAGLKERERRGLK